MFVSDRGRFAASVTHWNEVHPGASRAAEFACHATRGAGENLPALLAPEKEIGGLDFDCVHRWGSENSSTALAGARLRLLAWMRSVLERRLASSKELSTLIEVEMCFKLFGNLRWPRIPNWILLVDDQSFAAMTEAPNFS
ncbi:MAG: hypothetical protein GWO24_16310 [Akkermansiaceae bacterium]|nr:hypothetical protein [Akkermansiaceae bacterium]